jgi:hypothetical protein
MLWGTAVIYRITITAITNAFSINNSYVIDSRVENQILKLSSTASHHNMTEVCIMISTVDGTVTIHQTIFT